MVQVMLQVRVSMWATRGLFGAIRRTGAGRRKAEKALGGLDLDAEMIKPRGAPPSPLAPAVSPPGMPSPESRGSPLKHRLRREASPSHPPLWPLTGRSALPALPPPEALSPCLRSFVYSVSLPRPGARRGQGPVLSWVLGAWDITWQVTGTYLNLCRTNESGPPFSALRNGLRVLNDPFSHFTQLH